MNMLSLKALTSKALLVVIVCMSISVSQEKTIRLNFADRKFADKSTDVMNSLNNGEFFKVEIDSINLYLYKVTVGKRDTTIAPDKSFTVPRFADLINLDEISKLISSFQPSATLSRADLASEDQRKEITEFMNREEKTLRQIHRSLVSTKNAVDSVFFLYAQYPIVAQVEKDEDAKQFNLSNLSVSTLYSTLRKNRLTLDTLTLAALDLGARYADSGKRYSVIKTDKDLRARDEQLRKSIEELTNTLTKAKDSLSVNNTLDFISSVVTINNTILRKYTSLPLQLTKDQTVIDITIEPRDKKFLLHTYSTQLIIPLYPKESWSANSGFYVGYMKDEICSAKKINDTTHTLADENSSGLEFGVSATLSYWRRCSQNKSVYWSVGMGPAVSIHNNKVKPRLLVGGGWAWGGSRKVALGLGLIFGYNDKLSNTRDATVSVLRVGGYLSLSYLLFQ